MWSRVFPMSIELSESTRNELVLCKKWKINSTIAQSQRGEDYSWYVFGSVMLCISFVSSSGVCRVVLLIGSNLNHFTFLTTVTQTSRRGFLWRKRDLGTSSVGWPLAARFGLYGSRDRILVKFDFFYRFYQFPHAAPKFCKM